MNYSLVDLKAAIFPLLFRKPHQRILRFRIQILRVAEIDCLSQDLLFVQDRLQLLHSIFHLFCGLNKTRFGRVTESETHDVGIASCSQVISRFLAQAWRETFVFVLSWGMF
jgi:hypothetical protein